MNNPSGGDGISGLRIKNGLPQEAIGVAYSS